jgi:hypothetical protein
MKHPLQENVAVGALSFSEARRRITHREMTQMCLAVNMQMGSTAAGKLLDLLVASVCDDTTEVEG